MVREISVMNKKSCTNQNYSNVAILSYKSDYENSNETNKNCGILSVLLQIFLKPKNSMSVMHQAFAFIFIENTRATGRLDYLW